MPRVKAFNALARPYSFLETLTLGPCLKRARLLHMDHLSSARRVLLLGDGDGRFLLRLLKANPGCQAVSIDYSQEMIALARRRVDRDAPESLDRVQWITADARTLDFTSLGKFDAVATLFFFDCFTLSTLEVLIPRIASSVTPGAIWLHADFVEDAGNILFHWRNRFWLWVLYRLFDLFTEIEAKSFTKPHSLLEREGFQVRDRRLINKGLIESTLLQKRSH